MVDRGTGIPSVDRMDLHLDGVENPVALIIKGHLLVEEALRHGLVAAGHPTAANASLTAFKVITEAKACFFENHPRPDDAERMWDAVFALNTLRNRLAHN